MFVSGGLEGDDGGEGGGLVMADGMGGWLAGFPVCVSLILEF